MSRSVATTFGGRSERQRARDERRLFGRNLLGRDLATREADRRQLQAYQHLMTASESLETRMQDFVLPVE